jgi:hypothetical protein
MASVVTIREKETRSHSVTGYERTATEELQLLNWVTSCHQQYHHGDHAYLWRTNSAAGADREADSIQRLKLGLRRVLV